MPVLVVPFPTPLRVISSAPWGGGLGLRRFVINAQVPPGYSRHDPDAHLAGIARRLDLAGPGVGMLTAADVEAAGTAHDDGVEVIVTVGLGHPIRAAGPEGPTDRGVPRNPGDRGVPEDPGDRGVPEDDEEQATAGTINLIAVLPVRLSDAALVNAVATATEAKVQALGDLGFDATGTATDAVALACPAGGVPEPFGGPRSWWGGRLARAVHAAVLLAPVTG
jgi:adenosylcobinamide amidohydrolase